MQGYEGGSDRAADDATKSRPLEEGARRSERFACSVLDCLSAHVAVLDASGTIVAAIRAWKAFAGPNGADPRMVSEGVNYLGACDSASGPNAEGQPLSLTG
jgi:hypothetical protein